MSDIAIRVENLSKRYLLGHQATQPKGEATLRDNLISAAKGLVKRTTSMARGGQLVAGDEVEEFWALKDVSFEVKRGEVVGIIGRNGAGKSTLLKILSRITEPTSGRITLNGRVSSLLEVGTGFHPELSGRENIFLNGAILGMSRKEIQAKFDEIVDFAEVEKFLDTPVKRYSSGMYVRLAFAVAAHLEPEILIVDEVLAVGDVQFQKKCLGKMQSVAGEGRTVLFVSHDLNAVMRLCSRSILLSAGEIKVYGNTDAVVEEYKKLGRSKIISKAFENTKFSIRIENCRVDVNETGVILTYKTKINVKEDQPEILYAFDIVDSFGTVLGQAFSVDLGPDRLSQAEENTREFRVLLPHLIPGEYSVVFWAGPHNTITTFIEEDFDRFEIIESPSKKRTVPHTKHHGAIVPKMELANAA